MKSTFRKIGDYVELVDERNNNLSIDLLLGLSVTKEFIPSVANIIGTSMSNYKIIRKGQFACSLMQVRRDKKMPLALLQDYEEAIISQAYPVFKVKDESKLIPEYLMMWFTRSEFDREACFHAVGGVRGSIEWEDFMNMELPVPSIEKQREIVAEYNTVVDRIKLNEELNKKLEETAQTLYKHWFVDFEFPDENGNPYKSTGGEMVYNSELDKDIPKGWECSEIGRYFEYNSENYGKEQNYTDIMYLDTSNITENRIDEIQKLKVGKDIIPSRAKRIVKHNDIIYSTVRPNLKHYGLIKFSPDNLIVSTGFVVLRNKSKIYNSELLYQPLIQEELINELQSKAEMSVSTYPSIKPEDLLNISITLPTKTSKNLEKMNLLLKLSYESIYYNNMERENLIKLKELIQSKITRVL